MLSRKLFYLYSLIVFFPSLVTLMTCVVVSYHTLFSGMNVEGLNPTWILLLTLGFIVGLVATFLITFDLAGKPLLNESFQTKWLAMLLGLVCGFLNTQWAMPSLLFWLPQLIGTITLVLASYLLAYGHDRSLTP